MKIGSERWKSRRVVAAGCFPASAGAQISAELQRLDASLRDTFWRCELTALAAWLVLANLPLLFGGMADGLAFHPQAVGAGEWWRVLTHPFAHVSWYHLLLDAAAFFLAYSELRERRFVERAALVTAAGAGSLLAAVLASPAVAIHGLCGLSGLAHGLSAVVGVELFLRSREQLLRAGGLACLVIVVGKSVIEAATGNVLFADWHFGWLGTPIAVCHGGGVLGALVTWLILQSSQRNAR
jgi:rhomboid family GlyGly-CTERM serine protease